VADPFPLHVMTGQPAQLLMDKRQERVERVGFASVPGQEQRRRGRAWLANGSILCPFLGRAPFFLPFPPYRVTPGRKHSTRGALTCSKSFWRAQSSLQLSSSLH
jgi:hypothetical protein